MSTPTQSKHKAARHAKAIAVKTTRGEVKDAPATSTPLNKSNGDSDPSGQSSDSPSIDAIYWVGNSVAVAGTATLRVHSTDLRVGQDLEVFLKAETGDEMNAGVKLRVSASQSEVVVNVPASFTKGTKLTARVTAERNGSDPLEMRTAVPLCIGQDPAGPRQLLRGIAQYDPRWNEFQLVEKVKQYKTPYTNKPTSSWKDNGCHATSMAMVLRWIAEDNPTMKFTFPAKPGSKIPADHYPRRLVESFWPELGGQIKPTKGGSTPHEVLRSYAERALKMPDGTAGISLGAETLEHRLPIIKKALEKGPLLINIPDHFVVLQAIEGDDLLIVDPGNVLGTHWKHADGSPIETKKGMPDKNRWKGRDPGSDTDGRMYVRVPIRKKITRPAYGKKDSNGARPSDQWTHPEIAPVLLVEALRETAESYWVPETGAGASHDSAPVSPTPSSESHHAEHGTPQQAAPTTPNPSSGGDRQLLATIKKSPPVNVYWLPNDATKAFFWMGTTPATDFDGAPNCYAPGGKDAGALDHTENAGHNIGDRCTLKRYGGSKEKPTQYKDRRWWGVLTDNGEKNGTPVLQKEGDLKKGFYISCTSLKWVTEPSKDDPSKWVKIPHKTASAQIDATTIPYVAIPLDLLKTKASDRPKDKPVPPIYASPGDYAVLVNMKTKTIVGAIYADAKGWDTIDEASKAAIDLLGCATSHDSVANIVFTGSGDKKRRKKTSAEIQKNAKQLFEQWGGLNRLAALLNKK